MNFGGVIEKVVTSQEFSLEKAREIMKDEVIAVLGYGVQGPGQACNLRDNGFNVIVGQREGATYDKAVKDGWVPGETLFTIEEAAALFRIGENKLRKLAGEHPNSDFLIWNGNRPQIKRKMFEEYLEKCNAI